MNHRWGDVNDDGELSSPARFLGGCGPADLWLVEKNNVLICQYEDFPDGYVSYYPPSALYHHVMGIPLDDHEPGHLRKSSHVRWFGNAATEAEHDAQGIARYLAVFAPDLFTEEQRRDLLV